MKIQDVIKEFKCWNRSGWSKSEVPSTEALISAIEIMEMADENSRLISPRGSVYRDTNFKP